ncbi:MAG: DUF6702 family protein [Bacteroidia bacterium]
MIKLQIKGERGKKIRCTAKFIAVWLFLTVVSSGFVHPYYVSITELKHDAKKKSFQLSCRMFADNLESALKQIYLKNIDLLNPKDVKEADKLLSDYIAKHLLVSADGKTLKFTYIGYEKEEGAIWCYLEAKQSVKPKKVSIENSLLYEFKEQVSIMYVTVNEKRQSAKVTNPDKKAEFSFQ